MELGGHAPVIVCEVAGHQLAVKGRGRRAKFRNAGRVCIAPTRFLVHGTCARRLNDALAISRTEGGRRPAKGTQIKTRWPTRAAWPPWKGCWATPSSAAAPPLTRRRRAHRRGGQLLRAHGRLTACPRALRIFNEEPFGPVASVRGFTKLEDAIAEDQPRLPYGLAGYALRARSRTHLLSQRAWVEACCRINQPATPSAELPFGGIGTRALRLRRAGRRRWRPA